MQQKLFIPKKTGQCWTKFIKIIGKKIVRDDKQTNKAQAN